MLAAQPYQQFSQETPRLLSLCRMLKLNSMLRLILALLSLPQTARILLSKMPRMALCSAKSSPFARKNPRKNFWEICDLCLWGNNLKKYEFKWNEAIAIRLCFLKVVRKMLTAAAHGEQFAKNGAKYQTRYKFSSQPRMTNFLAKTACTCWEIC